MRLASSAVHRPSAPLAMFAATTWVCSCGSCALDIRCRYAAATNPPPGSDRARSHPRGFSARAPPRSRYAHGGPCTRHPPGTPRGVDRLLMRLHKRPREFLVADREQHTHALRRRERHVDRGRTCNAPSTSLAAPPLSGFRPSIIAFNARAQAHRTAPASRPFTGPPPRRFALPRVVVLTPCRDLLLVVHLLRVRHPDLPDRQHPLTRQPGDPPTAAAFVRERLEVRRTSTEGARRCSAPTARARAPPAPATAPGGRAGRHRRAAERGSAGLPSRREPSRPV